MTRSRASILRRRRAVVGSLLALVLGVGAYVPLTLLSPLDSASAEVVDYSVAAPEPVTLAMPAGAASAVSAVDREGMLQVDGTDEPLPIASITKIITALTVLDAKPLAVGENGPEIGFTAADVAIRDAYRRVQGKVMPVAAGLRLTQLEVLQLVLIESANNYAESLAVWAFGSERGHVDAANAWLAENGFARTTVVDSTGMSPDNRSTATELVALGRLALEHPVVATLVGTARVEVPGVGEAENTNLLLGVGGVDGIKTGTLDEAGKCLLFSTDLAVGDETVTVVGAVLGAADHRVLAEQAAALLDSVRAGYRTLPLAQEGTVVGSYSTEWGESSDIVVAESGSILEWSDAVVSSKVETVDVGAAPAGTRAGTLTVTVDGVAHEFALELADDIADPGPWWRLANPLVALG